ncbi:hypothetical protein BKK79_25335 [Cupriavidus sp. USMAA2-4]|uniref:HTH luxR-type domain-containing protein n=1 Tax=Cupriavidus malaysiensis TaxID=367825 RepID=A0ABM6F9D7_9BURK|nr:MULTISPECIES: response regulator transcription factor [Cupriavidus]AOY95130.1 hypothetical protein BKK79_25335 [Cupriavidus sp. USMAA2-4]AOZ01973.1 hypothetical protein BKK81_21760 [Cupriavidus sp. USMAHM13]AOZ08292.1 hypothetical protein BKK80_20105 [Cupriavidus malaysiensis]
MASILLIEPHPLLRLGLRHLLAQSRLHDVILDIDPDQQLPLPADACGADLLLLGLPAGSASAGTMLLEAVARLQPKRMLLLAESVDGLDLGELPEGVRGILSKHSSADLLDAAIHLVLAGGECFPGHVTAPAAPAAEPARHPAPAGPSASGSGETETETPLSGSHLLNITERQYEVLVLLARGYPIKTVSRVLNISVATAKTHACTLYQRLQVRNKGEAVYVALQRGATLNWPGPQLSLLPQSCVREAA